WCTACAATKCSVRSVRVEAFLSRVRADPDLALWTSQMLANESLAHLRRATGVLVESPRERLSGLLRELVRLGPTFRRRNGIALRAPLSRKEMAALIGVGPEC